VNPNAELIEQFYAAFNQRDADAMVQCYAPEVVFEDPAFGELHGPEASAMWHMLCERATELKVSVSGIEADADRGRARWEAHYLFSQTGRNVHNIIDASFRFEGGRIVEHRDHFDLWRWSRQALGAPGWLLGWSGLIRSKVQTQARANLRRYMDSATRE
jgi:limonene-1,2-epoxide hydrolase